MVGIHNKCISFGKPRQVAAVSVYDAITGRNENEHLLPVNLMKPLKPNRAATNSGNNGPQCLGFDDFLYCKDALRPPSDLITFERPRQGINATAITATTILDEDNQC
jgi:hypothetical protein